MASPLLSDETSNNRYYARSRRRRRSGEVEKNSDEVNVDQRVTCDDVVKISGGEFKKRRKRKKKAVTGTKINGEAEDLLEFMMDDDQEEHFVATDSVDPELLVAETLDYSVFNKLIRMPRYFNQESFNWWFCYNCNEEGHVTANCKHPRRKKPCFVCGMLGHDARKCSKGHTCSICKGRGHLTKDCSDKKTPNSKVCLRCGSIGHDMSNCVVAYDPEDIKMMQCYVCQCFGHLCCMAIETNTSHKIACYNCGKIGHSGDVCVRSYHQATLNVNSSSSYYKCGKEDHFTRLRTNNNKIDQWSGESSIPILKKIAKQHTSELLLSKSSPLCEFARFTKKKTPRFGKRNFIMSTPLKMKKKHGWIVDFHDDLLYNRVNRRNSIGCSSRKIRKSPPPRRRGFGSNSFKALVTEENSLF